MEKNSNHSLNAENKEQKLNNTESFIPIQSAVEDTLTAVEQRMLSNKRVSGLATGWFEYDRETCGLHNGDLIIVGSRPKMGKTAFCLNIAIDVGVYQQKNVVLFSLELSTEQLAMRIISSLSKVPLEIIRTAQLDGDDWLKVSAAKKQLSNAPIFIYDVGDNSRFTPEDLHSKCQRLISHQGKLDLVIVDYLQLMSGAINASPADQAYEISRSLKRIAGALNCPVVALSQLRRSLEFRPNKRPITSDFHQSGAIEEDADNITLIYRGAVYAGADETEKQADKTAEIIIAKQRNGMPATFKLNFHGATMRFVSPP